MINYHVFSIDPAFCERVMQENQTSRYLAQPWRSTLPENASTDSESWQYWRIDIMNQDPAIQSANNTVEVSNLQEKVYDWVARYIWTATIRGIKGFLFNQPGTHQSGQDRWAHAECWQQHDHAEYMVITAIGKQGLSLRMQDQDQQETLYLNQGETVIVSAHYPTALRLSEEDMMFQILTFEIQDPTTGQRGLELDFGSHGQPLPKKSTRKNKKI